MSPNSTLSLENTNQSVEVGFDSCCDIDHQENRLPDTTFTSTEDYLLRRLESIIYTALCKVLVFSFNSNLQVYKRCSLSIRF